MRHLVLVLLLAAAASMLARSLPAQEVDPRIDRGKALAESLCAGCHAIGVTGASPHGAAPPFRSLERRIDLDDFLDRLRQGLTSGHPDMPTFRFTREDGRALIAYLRSIQQP
jgi:cytochrome c